MTIHELLQAAGLTANDEIPIWDVDGTGEPTKKITAQQLATAVVALANLVTGVKGGAEGSYRHGNVNLTPANIGAHPAQTNLVVINDTDYAGDTTASKPVVQIMDTSNFVRHQLYGLYNSSGTFYTCLAARRPNGSSAITNQILLGFDANGNGSYIISYPEAFRSAIGVTPANIGAFGAGSVGAITDANDTSLYGSRFFQANACANLPTNESGVYYLVEFFGICQMAFRYSSTGITETWGRYYANDIWYPWVRIDGVDGVRTGDVANNLTTTEAGKVLDARQGNILNALIDGLISNTSLGTYSGYAAAAEAVWAAMGNTSVKVGKITIEVSGMGSYITVYLAVKSSANYAAVLFVSFSTTLHLAIKTNGTTTVRNISTTAE